MKRRVWQVAGMLLLLQGCETAKQPTATHLIYVYSASLGIDVSAPSANNGSVKLSVGYDRQTFAIVPRTRSDASSDAMSIMSSGRAEVQGLNVIKFGQIVATGEPAVRMAKNPSDMSVLVQKLFPEEAVDKQNNANQLVAAKAAAPAPAGGKQ